jgi:flagellin FlaB
MSGENRVRWRKGLTGIETAIILIAFVIVAAVFAFAVLNIGFQTTQKAQDVMRAGMEQASSALELDGAVIAYKGNNFVNNITLAIRLSPGRSPIALSQDFFAVAVTTQKKYWSNVYRNSTAASPAQVKCDASLAPEGVAACIYPIIDRGAVGFLEHGDKFLVIIAFRDQTVAPEVNTPVTIELKPAVGDVLTVQRIMPLVLTDVMFLG